MYQFIALIFAENGDKKSSPLAGQRLLAQEENMSLRVEEGFDEEKRTAEAAGEGYVLRSICYC